MTNSAINPTVTGKNSDGSYAPVNGLNLYYETYGRPSPTGAPPLILLHGGLGVIGMFSQVLSPLAEARQVIGVELQAHGHTADIDRPLSFEAMADDIAALIKYLGYENADVLGYSLGGGVALQTAIRHPDAVRRLVVVSGTFKRVGWYPDTLAGMSAVSGDLARGWVGSPMQIAYASVAPKPEDWPMLADKVGNLLRQDYDWSKSVAEMKMPTLIVIGDADGVMPAHAVEMYELLGGGTVSILPDGSMTPHSGAQLAILPNTTHFSILDRANLLLPIVTQFLDAPVQEAK